MVLFPERWTQNLIHWVQLRPLKVRYDFCREQREVLKYSTEERVRYFKWLIDPEKSVSRQSMCIILLMLFIYKVKMYSLSYLWEKPKRAIYTSTQGSYLQASVTQATVFTICHSKNKIYLCADIILLILYLTSLKRA